MIKILNCCYYFSKSMDLLKSVRFTNNGYFTVKAIIQYTLRGYTVTENIILERRRTKKFNLPRDSTNICLNILNLSNPDPIKSVLYHECISGEENVCFEISNTTENPVITRNIC
ncbi:hypothetical protein Z959_12710 [Clostridium novyi B str. ATCC 27606]|uniref:Uncharacterized protein n=1 Tax=Clostridium novyi B str. ATCC 27606 TaxID=1443123 RepID=A0AA40M1I1_CLONO|nr:MULTISPECIES: hypothetical protein [Clostridium]KEI08541.1 hypothetical protein Z958_12750 [Clostridium novyi B str. NCTC 9691]KEI11952.1 hypothetical protein Z959_12710 [Clostridium novyi B str. ATCC 27606]OOB76519.1 hypothetical protein AXF41_11765 [Clostridium haemolyticum]